MGLLGYLYHIVTGICHNAHIAPISNDDFNNPKGFNSLNKNPLHATSSGIAETVAIDKPIITFIMNVLWEKIVMLNLRILIKLINNAITMGINIENKNQKLGLKEIFRELFNFCLKINFWTIITEMKGKIIGIPIKFAVIRFDFPPITCSTIKNKSVITYVKITKYMTFLLFFSTDNDPPLYSLLFAK